MERMAKQRRIYSELPVRFLRSTFDNFDTDGRDETIRGSQRVCRDYADGRSRSRFLVLVGSMGTGKTHLAAAIVNARMNDMTTKAIGKFQSVPEMLQRFRDGYGDGSYRSTFDLLRRAPLLVLDDLGAEYQRVDSVMTWAAEQLYLLINDRYMNEKELVVTTNVASERLEPRILDRLVDTSSGFSTVVSMMGDSYRRTTSDGA